MLTGGPYGVGDPMPKSMDLLITFGAEPANAALGVTIKKVKSNFFLNLFGLTDTWVVEYPALPPGSGTPALFRNISADNWVMVPEQRFADLKIRARLSYYGYYEVFIPNLNLPYSLGELAFGDVYVYPNPVKGGETPVLHVEIGKVDVIRMRIYDIAGDLVFEGRIDAAVKVVNGLPAYEQSVDPSRFKSGAYIGVVTAEKAGKEAARKKFRFSVIK